MSEFGVPANTALSQRDAYIEFLARSPVDLGVRLTHLLIKLHEMLGGNNIVRWMLVTYHDTLDDQWIGIECSILDIHLRLSGKGTRERRRKVLELLLCMNLHLIEIGEPATRHLVDRNVLMVVAAELERGVSELSTKHNDQRKAAAAAEQARWQQQANAIWARSPWLKRTRVAKLIDPQRANYIRRKITPIRTE